MSSMRTVRRALGEIVFSYPADIPDKIDDVIELLKDAAALLEAKQVAKMTSDAVEEMTPGARDAARVVLEKLLNVTPEEAPLVSRLHEVAGEPPAPRKRGRKPRTNGHAPSVALAPAEPVRGLQGPALFDDKPVPLTES